MHGMHIRIIDLDGSLLSQPLLFERYRPSVVGVSSWGPDIRLNCSFGKFGLFEQALAAHLGEKPYESPMLTFCGSGDFHHVSLALVRRQRQPFNLLVLDNHPDWMRGVPFLHCGTWLYHAARWPGVRRIFHVGGDVDFDNAYRWLAPWGMLRSGQISVLPARRRLRGQPWLGIGHEPLRPGEDTPVTAERIAS